MGNKICSKCKCKKAVDDFPFKNKNKGVRHYTCSVCWKEIRKISYEKNKKTTLDRNTKNANRNREWYEKLKKELSCVNCGENHPACLDFHHLKNKHIEVSNMITGTYSIERIQEEINKCIVLCSNCHRKLHYDEK